MPRYETERDAIQALSQSIIVYNNLPAYVRGCSDRNTMRICPLGPEAEGENVAIDSPLTDLTPVSLGYVNNIEGRALFSSRMPARRWKQGLNEGNLHINQGNFREVFNTPSLRDTILNTFPSFDECLDRVEGLVDEGVAFCRNFAIINGMLEHRGRTVGTIEDGEAVLLPRFQYLHQSLNLGMR